MSYESLMSDHAGTIQVLGKKAVGLLILAVNPCFE